MTKGNVAVELSGECSKQDGAAVERTFAGRITIGRSQSSHGPDTIRIEITDANNGVRVVEVSMTPDNFGRAITGLSYLECVGVLGQPELVNAQHELKQETVFVPDGDYKLREKRAAEACKPFEIDGWKASVSDACNPHRWTKGRVEGGHTYSVNFHRYVPASRVEPK